MHICILIYSFWPVVGGAEVVTFKLAKLLVKMGHKVSVIATSQAQKKLPKFERIEDIDIYRFPELIFPTRLGRALSWRNPFCKILEVANAIAPFFYLKPLLKETLPDVLNMHYVFPTGYAGYFWAKRLKVPTLLTLYGNDIYDPYYVQGKILFVFSKMVINKVKSITCLSNFVKSVLVRKFKADSKKITVIPSGVETHRFSPSIKAESIKKKYNIKKEEKLILSVQRLHVRKGLEFSLKAFALIKGKRKDVKFLIVGEGPEKKKLLKLAQDLHISDVVFFTGHVSEQDLPKYYAACDIFAFHSVYESLGVVLLEAISSGKPVVTTSVGGIVDIIKDGVNGLLVRPCDSLAFARAILSILNQPQLMKKMGKEARRIALEKFDWQKVSHSYFNSYQSLLAKTGT